jgi:hypothetical protein
MPRRPPPERRILGFAPMAHIPLAPDGVGPARPRRAAVAPGGSSCSVRVDKVAPAT